MKKNFQLKLLYCLSSCSYGSCKDRIILFHFRKSRRDEKEFPVCDKERPSAPLRLCLRRHQRRQALLRRHREGRRVQKKSDRNRRSNSRGTWKLISQIFSNEQWNQILGNNVKERTLKGPIDSGYTQWNILKFNKKIRFVNQIFIKMLMSV